MKMFLTVKPPRTRSKTEISTKNQDCPEATTNLAAVEAAEHDTEAVSCKFRDASSLESNNKTVKKSYKLKSMKTFYEKLYKQQSLEI